MRSFTNLVWKPFDGVEPHCSMTFLEIFSSKKFSRVVVYCSVIKVPVVLFKRQLWYSTKAHFVCQELFSFSVSLFCFLYSQLSATACLGYHISTALSTSFLTVSLCLQTRFFRSPASGCSASASPADLISRGFSGPVISDRCYLITTGRNCQCFSCFLFISDNSCNSDKL